MHISASNIQWAIDILSVECQRVVNTMWNDVGKHPSWSKQTISAKLVDLFTSFGAICSTQGENVINLAAVLAFILPIYEIQQDKKNVVYNYSPERLNCFKILCLWQDSHRI